MFLRKFTPFAIGLATLIAPASASAPQMAATAWVVDGGASALNFTGQASGSPFEGKFTAWESDIHFDPDNLAGSSAKVTIDMASAYTGDPSKDGYMLDDAWFAPITYPTATFETTQITHVADNAYLARGTLTIRSISKAVELPFTVDIHGDTAHMTGNLTLTRTDFSVGTGSWSDDSQVGLSVTVGVSVAAKKAG